FQRPRCLEQTYQYRQRLLTAPGARRILVGTGAAPEHPRTPRCDPPRWPGDRSLRLVPSARRLGSGTPCCGCLHPSAEPQRPRLLLTSDQTTPVTCHEDLRGYFCRLSWRSDRERPLGPTRTA